MPYEPHPLFADPADEFKLWRYMDFTKLVSLLFKKKIFFTRADNFSDPFEGSFPKKEIEVRCNKIRKKLRSGQSDASSLKETAANLSAQYKDNRQYILMNCWHYNNYESLAMWKLFLKSDEGVAIHTSCDRLKLAFKNFDKAIHIGKVRYLDYESQTFFDGQNFPSEEENIAIPFIHKRNFFSYENEYRAILNDTSINWEEEESQSGKFIPVDLETLIEKIVVSPDAELWFSDLVQEQVAQFAPGLKVEKSRIGSRPLF